MIAIVLILYSFMPAVADAETNDEIQRMEQFIERQQAISKIPGIAVVIVEKGETVYQKGFGYANAKAKTEVTSSTLFELGSTSKAFTGLAILQLERSGLLQRSDDVRKYIPWLELKYNEEPQTITLDQLLHHTSGIGSNSIARIPESTAENALEMTVRTLLEQPLNRKPGSSFEYATINYDVLGYVIETVTKQPFDVYMKQRILEPIGMNNTYVGLHQLQSNESNELASGYKIGFRKEKAYTPPVYKGNIPAGYIISNMNDIAIWLKLQLGNASSQVMDKQLIEESHVPDHSVAPFDQDTYYAKGWGVMKKDQHSYLFHAGENPSFSSYFIMQPDRQLGVAILSNMNSSYTTAIGQGVMDLWEGRDIAGNHSDAYQKLDEILTFLCITIGCFGALLLFLWLWICRKIVKGQRIKASLHVKRVLLLAIHTLAAAAAITFVIMVPDIMLGGLPWAFIQVWAPMTVPVFLYSVITVTLIYYVFGLTLIFTRKTRLS